MHTVNGMREGYTTGSCATAASLVAALRVLGLDAPALCAITLPDRSVLEIPVVEQGLDGNTGYAVVRKDAGDDPDVTHQALLRADVRVSPKPGVQFHAGPGVGTVTRAGLQISPGNAAINPVPRRMISDHLLALHAGWEVTLSIENGEELAAKTFNPRLGIIGGLSILGTTGRVRPFSHESQLCSLRCAFGIAQAASLTEIFLVPGHMGERALRGLFPFLSGQALLEAGNDWGFALDCARAMPLGSLGIAGHPGKLAKFLDGHWDTHSSRSPSALPIVRRFWEERYAPIEKQTQTVEGFLQEIRNFDSSCYTDFIAELAQAIRKAAMRRLNSPEVRLDLWLTGMQGEILSEAHP